MDLGVKAILALSIIFVIFLSGCTDSTEVKISEDPITGESTHVSSENTTAKVTLIVDGDTLGLDTGERVRLVCINTPEKGTNYASEAKAALSKLVLNKTVTLERDTTDKDAYGRLLRYIWLGDKLVNGVIVGKGLAEVYKYGVDLKYCDSFDKLLKNAEDKKLGMWSQEGAKDNPCVQLGCPAGTAFVGSSGSTKYHTCTCKWAKKISIKNLVCFKNAKEATGKGYEACKTCA